MAELPSRVRQVGSRDGGEWSFETEEGSSSSSALAPATTRRNQSAAGGHWQRPARSDCRARVEEPRPITGSVAVSRSHRRIAGESDAAIHALEPVGLTRVVSFCGRGYPSSQDLRSGNAWPQAIIVSEHHAIGIDGMSRARSTVMPQRGCRTAAMTSACQSKLRRFDNLQS